MKKGLILVLTVSSICLMRADFANAKACFIVGGCDDQATTVNSKSCTGLGYKYVEDGQCGEHSVIDKNSKSCSNNGKTYYMSCKCDPSYYKYSASDDDDDNNMYNFDEKCPTEDIYAKKICDSKYKYIDENDIKGRGRDRDRNNIFPDKDNMVSNYLLDILGLNNKTRPSFENDLLTRFACSNNSVPGGDVCKQPVDDKKAKASLGSSFNRYTKCVCPTDYVKAEGLNTNIFVKDTNGKECINSDDQTYYEKVNCSGKVTAEGTWKSDCNGSTEYASSHETAGITTCHLCKPKCNGITKDECTQKLMSSVNNKKNKHCEYISDNCYQLTDGGICPIN